MRRALPTVCRYGKWHEILLGIILATVALLTYNSRRVDAANLALGKDTFSVAEQWKGKPFTAYSPNLIENLIRNTSVGQPCPAGATCWLWLGNSQLHAINQLKEGDRLAPYWARESLPCPDCVVPVGISVPNANLQEFLLLSRYVESKLSLKGIVIELPFIGLREDGVRDELSSLVDPALKEDLTKTAAGEDVVRAIDIADNKDGAPGAGHKATNNGHDLQAGMEDFFESETATYFPLWKDRSQLKTNFLVDLYFFKNWLLGIKPNTVRKVIKARYERNMRALEDILAREQREGVRVILYIAPLRQDMQLPYDPEEYATWKSQVEMLAGQYGARYLNLERLVPVQYWGTYGKEDIDFMHFQGPGHKLVGQVLAKYMVK